MEKSKSLAKKGKQSQKELVFNILQAKFRDNPEIIREHLPEIASLLEEQGGKQGRLFRDYLTERERQARINSLGPILDKYVAEGRLTKEEGIRALEDAAALKEHIPDKEAMVRMVMDVFRFAGGAEKKTTITVRNDLRKYHSYKLARGIELLLSWDGKLLAIEVDGKELAHRRRALAFVGLARDSISDVAKHHDKYIWEPSE